jgi:hypothetical protein
VGLGRLAKEKVTLITQSHSDSLREHSESTPIEMPTISTLIDHSDHSEKILNSGCEWV